MTDPAARAVLLVVGLSHQTAALAAREQVSLDDGRARILLRGLRTDPAIREAAVLSTCNRTEIYALATSRQAGEEALRRALVERTSLGAATLCCSAYALFEHDAAEHLFRVAAGLESAILGETEIGGQVRAAAQRARQEGTLGTVLCGAFDRSLAAARRVRRRTGISVGATSVGSVVASLVDGAPSAAPNRRIALLGAGRLARSLAGALAAVPGAELVVVNRTPAAARALAGLHGSTAAGLAGLDAELRRADALVCATGAPQPIVSADTVQRARAGLDRPLLIVDLAVPRDVEPAAAGVPGVALHDVDAIQRMVSRNLAVRRHEAQTAAEMVRRETQRFTAWRRELEAVPALRSVWRQADELRRMELARLDGAVSAEERERLDRVTAAIVRKLLHGPSERLRAACATADAAAHVESFRMLFDIDAEPAADPAANVIAMPQSGAAR